MKIEKLGLIIGFIISISLAWFSYAFLDYKNTHQTLRESSSLMETAEILDQRVTDIKYRLRPPRKSSAPVALVAIDEASINELGRWPWDRDVIANITQKLIGYGAKSVAFDVIFSEPDRSNPKGDDAFAKLITENQEKIILGTFSESQFNFQPHQDICVTEAFLATGGDQLVKPSPLFIIDEPSTSFDDLNWSPLFTALFSNIQNEKEQEVLQMYQKNNISELNIYQQRYLASQKTTALFDYCKTWLSKDDIFLSPDVIKNVKPVYASVMATNKELSKLNFDQLISKIKESYKTHPVPQYGEWKPNINILQQPAAYTASFIALLDSDGYVRHYPLYFRSGNRLGTSYIPSLALQSWLLANPRRIEVKGSVSERSRSVDGINVIDTSKAEESSDGNLPVDKSGDLIINYYGRQMALPYISASEVLNDRPTIRVQRSSQKSGSAEVVIEVTEVNKADFFKDRSLIFGATAVGIYDLRNTPLEANYPGPEIHLTVLANLLDKSFLKNWGNETLWIPWIILLLCLSIALLCSYFGVITSSLLFASLLGFALLTDWILFDHYGILIKSFTIYVSMTLTLLVVQGFRYFTEERTKKELKNTFSKYVSPAVVDELLKDVDNLKLGGRREHMTAFFSDVRGFTTISEKLTPEELSRVLNLYLTPMTEIVFKNKGTLDKYMGDALMAFFGAPVKDPLHAKNACRCALESIEKLYLLQKEFKEQSLPYIDIGIGLNTGAMSVGNMGSNIVQNYTIMGDAVNLASRLEGINKQYGTRIIISQFTYAEVKDSFTAREIDRVKVKGKTEPVRIYELICEGQTSPIKQKFLSLFEAGYANYQNRNFAAALKAFTRDELLDDSVSKIFRERCEEYIKTPPASDWDGAYVMKSK